MGTESSPHTMQQRRDAHLDIAARASSRHAGTPGLERVRLRHRALPGRDLGQVTLHTRLLGATLAAPVLISSMTGGTPRARDVNARLARAATSLGVGMALGSGRALLADRSLLDTYRTSARPPLLLANLGAGQLGRGVAPADAERLVGLLEADGLVVHLNPLQEALQAEGDTQFGGLLDRVAEVVQRLQPRPVVVKEVGFGLAPEDVADLVSIGVAGIDIAGAGGTNWALVEGQRDPQAGEIATAFADWGWPTATSLRLAVPLARPAGAVVIASGGLTNGVEAAKALALGAHAVGLARPLLLAALEDRAEAALATVIQQLRLAVWLTGRPSAAALTPVDLMED